jgi:hypothetical protein
LGTSEQPIAYRVAADKDSTTQRGWPSEGSGHMVIIQWAVMVAHHRVFACGLPVDNLWIVDFWWL